MSWPAVIEQDRVFEPAVSTLDVLPTFLTAAGIVLPGDREYDGVDLVPYLDRSMAGVPHDTLHWKMQWGAAVRAGDWKLVRTPLEEHWLFNLAEDVSESNDVADENPAVVSALRGSLESWESTHPDPIWRIDNAWHARTLERYDQSVVDGFVRD
jgi:arylsulfatase A-like enzyme